MNQEWLDAVLDELGGKVIDIGTQIVEAKWKGMTQRMRELKALTLAIQALEEMRTL